MTYIQCFPGLNELNLVIKCPVKCTFDSPDPDYSLTHDQTGVGTTKLVLTRQYVSSGPTCAPDLICQPAPTTSVTIPWNFFNENGQHVSSFTGNEQCFRWKLIFLH